jgi:hypothetical protein
VIDLKAKAERIFFDNDKLLKLLTRAEIKVLSKFGAFVMTSARRSMRSGGKKGKVSLPGEPPRAHKGTLKKGRYGVQFAYDTGTKSVVVGAQKFGRNRRNSDTVPANLEYGGTLNNEGKVITVKRKPGRNARGQFVTAGTERITLHGRARIAARPYMGPAFKKEKPKLMGMWKDALNKV